MKVTIRTSAKGIETANYLLSMAVDQARELSPEGLKKFDLSKTSVDSAEKFRLALIKAFLK